jgi:hypothetical protein
MGLDHRKADPVRQGKMRARRRRPGRDENGSNSQRRALTERAPLINIGAEGRIREH